MLHLFQIKVSLLKNAKNLLKLLKITIWLIVRMCTNRGSTVRFIIYEHP